MRLVPFLLALTLSSCVSGGPPQYMTDAVRGEEDARRALDRIEVELGPEFQTRVVEEIFFIASNGGSRSLEIAEGTIRRTVEELYRTYLNRKPRRPVRVYCFRDKRTYDAYVRAAYNREPSTPFGFYLASERKMVLNLETGAGTLAHEVVHPLVGEDFPGIPAWFNEGFASLFEATMKDSNGAIVGRHNWRLGDLKRARLPLRTLMETNTDEFYGETRGLHYAMARYFCLYLQRQDLLARFYREFRETVEADPTGVAALERVTRKSLAAFEEEWTGWIRELPWSNRR